MRSQQGMFKAAEVLRQRASNASAASVAVGVLALLALAFAATWASGADERRWALFASLGCGCIAAVAGGVGYLLGSFADAAEAAAETAGSAATEE